MPIIDAYGLVGAWPRAEVDLSVEALAASMQSRGVGHCLVTHTAAIFYENTEGNRQAIQLAAQHGPLSAVAVINPLDYPDCLTEVKRCLDQGVKVFRLCPREHGYPLSGAVGPLRAVLEALSGAKLIVIDAAELPAPVITSDVPALLKVPTAISVHTGGLGTLLHAGTISPHVWAETSRLEAGGAIETAVKVLGTQRVVFGSAQPLRSVGSAVMSVQFAEITEADRQAVFEGNIQRALG